MENIRPMEKIKSASSGWRELIVEMADLWGGIALSTAQVDKQEKAVALWKEAVGRNAHLLSPSIHPDSFQSALHFAGNSARSARHRSESFDDAYEATISDEAHPDWWDQRNRIKVGECSVHELAGQALDELEKVGKKTGACVEVFRDTALAAAAAMDGELKQGASLGAVSGMPLAHKDIFFRKNGPVTCGLGFAPAFGSEQDATVLTRLQQHGALNLGRLHMTELAFDPSGVNERLGDCLNPWSGDHVPGGSSSGSATAVASRAVYAALGTDTGGSIRIPAVLCGATGLKPTYDLVSRGGAMALSWTNDHIGPIAMTARDCALVMSALAPVKAGGHGLASADFLAGPSTSVKGLRLGVPEAFFRSGLPAQFSGLLDASLKVFEQLGLEIKAVPDFDYEALNALGSLITRAEAYSTFNSYIKAQGNEQICATTRLRLEEGLAVPAGIYLQALSLRAPLLRQFLSSVMADVDVLHLPVCGIETPLLTDSRVGAASHSFVLDSLTRLNRPFNYLGLPALALPCGFASLADKGLKMPYGFQLVGAPFDDALLLHLGNAYQSVTDWHCHAPGRD